ncbi:MAG: hypothetical protein IT325_10575 [Anaerolineae bacterium]|nr:hypothetical protein [Anaerolineae bacterium]
MRRIILVVVIMLGVGFLYGTTPSRAQDDAEPEFIGSRLCFGCHRDVGPTHLESRHALTLSAAADDGAIVGDFAQISDALVIQLPGENEPRALTPDDIAYAVGTGRNVQRYLFAVESEATESEESPAEYLVLPVEWNVRTGQWQPYTLAGGEWPSPAYDWEDQCAACHATGFSVETGAWLEDGVQCETCHGPGSDHLAVVRSRGATPAEISASIVLSPDSAICGACHSQGASADGHPYPVDYVAGDNLLADGGFTLFPPGDEAHWWPSGHARQKYMQFNEWLNSTHATSLDGLRASERAEDACLVCHSVDYVWGRVPGGAEASEDGGTLASVTIANAAHGVECVSCHVIHPESGAPAGLDFMLSAEPYAMCVECHQDTDVTGVIHAPVKEMYEGEALIEGVEGVPSAHFVAAGGPTCVTCHMPRVPVDAGTRGSHAFHPVMPGAALDVETLQDSCSICHADQVGAAGLQQLIDDIQADTQARLETARAAMTAEAADWVDAALRFVEGDGSLGVHNYVYTDRVLDRVERELGLIDGAGNP